jgi:DNA-binding CsgD family transcriptional regulator
VRFLAPQNAESEELTRMTDATSVGLDRARLAAETLAIVGLPACVVDSGGRALAVNDLFETLAPGVVAVLGDRVCVENKIANELLDQYMEQLNTRGPKALSSILVPTTERLPAFILHLVSTRRSARDIFKEASGLIVAAPLSKPPIPSVRLVAALFGLTRAEARVAEGITQGKSVNRLAAELGLSAATVRSYLKSVFGKTGVHRQAELVSLLARAQPLRL